MKQYLAIDIGGTEIKYGVVDETGTITKKNRMETSAQKGGEHIIQTIRSLIVEQKQMGRVEGICISTAGMVDVEKGEIFYASPLIPGYTGMKMKQRLEEEFKIPCEVENDVNCAGLAEVTSGAAKGAKVALCLTVGTGIGGCMLLDGNVFHGWSNSACEIGYMHLEGGAFQTLGATSALVKKVAYRKKESIREWNGYRIFEAAKVGDETCIQAIDEMCQVLGKGIANICYVLNPQVVVLGGGIMMQKDYLQKPMEQALSTYLIPAMSQHTKLVFASHQNDAGMLGAYYHYQMRRGLWSI